LTRRGFPNEDATRQAWGCSIAGSRERLENCQVGVFLSYVTAKGHTLIDRELYLPLDWLEDRERCQAAGIPASVHFQTKPELAVQMIERIRKAAVPIAWVVADTVYGGNLDLRAWLEASAYSYVLAVACNEPVGILTGSRTTQTGGSLRSGSSPAS
jgi:SRSO17 transposase